MKYKTEERIRRTPGESPCMGPRRVVPGRCLWTVEGVEQSVAVGVRPVPIPYNSRGHRTRPTHRERKRPLVMRLQGVHGCLSSVEEITVGTVNIPVRHREVDDR